MFQTQGKILVLLRYFEQSIQFPKYIFKFSLFTVKIISHLYNSQFIKLLYEISITLNCYSIMPINGELSHQNKLLFGTIALIRINAPKIPSFKTSKSKCKDFKKFEPET